MADVSNSRHSFGPIGEFAIGEFFIDPPFVSKWMEPWPEPVRTRRFQPAEQPFVFFGPEPPVFDTDDWFQPFSQPLYPKKGLRAHLQQAFAQDPTPFPTGRNLGWYEPFSQPLYRKRGLATQDQPFFAFEAEPPILEEMPWFEPWGMPVWRKRPISQYVYPFPWSRVVPPLPTYTYAYVSIVEIQAIAGGFASNVEAISATISANVSIIEVPAETGSVISIKESGNA